MNAKFSKVSIDTSIDSTWLRGSTSPPLPAVPAQRLQRAASGVAMEAKREETEDFQAAHQLEILAANSTESSRLGICVGNTPALKRVLLDSVAVTENQAVFAQSSPGALFIANRDAFSKARFGDVVFLSPVAWPGGHPVASLSCGLFHVAFVSDGCVYTLGQDTVGQLGIGEAGRCVVGSVCCHAVPRAVWLLSSHE